MPPPSPSAPPVPPPDERLLNAQYLNPLQCSALFADRNSRFHQLWGEEGWVVQNNWNGPCWRHQPNRFYDDALSGASCNRNWYEGNQGPLGRHDGGPTVSWVSPKFTGPAPALLGFDQNIDGWCGSGGNDHAAGCVRSNYNILSLYSPAQYNTCRNFEWQMCAALGQLPGQGSRTIRFAYAPGALEAFTGWRPLGSCTGWHPRGCGNNGYASSDIFILEVCLYSAICSNAEQMFALDENEDWVCNINPAGVEQLRHWLFDE